MSEDRQTAAGPLPAIPLDRRAAPVSPPPPGQPDRRSGTMTSTLIEAIRLQLEARRGVLDAARGLGSIQITVRLDIGTPTPSIRAVNVAEEHITRNLARRGGA